MQMKYKTYSIYNGVLWLSVEVFDKLMSLTKTL